MVLLTLQAKPLLQRFEHQLHQTAGKRVSPAAFDCTYLTLDLDKPLLCKPYILRTVLNVGCAVLKCTFKTHLKFTVVFHTACILQTTRIFSLTLLFSQIYSSQYFTSVVSLSLSLFLSSSFTTSLSPFLHLSVLSCPLLPHYLTSIIAVSCGHGSIWLLFPVCAL